MNILETIARKVLFAMMLRINADAGRNVPMQMLTSLAHVHVEIPAPGREQRNTPHP